MSNLDPEERESILEEIEDLASLRDVFEERGFKGVMITCAECGEDHYYDWDMLKESLANMLQTGEPLMHEPAVEPDPDQYISWDYGRGWLDAAAEGGAIEMEAPPSNAPPATAWVAERTRCAWCRGRLPGRALAEWIYCPFCGSSLAPLRLVDALLSKGFSEEDVTALMDECGFEPPLAAGEDPTA